MSSGSVSFGGFNSGLDTDRIVSQLLQIERQPIRRYKQDINEAQTTQDAFKSLNSTVGGLEQPSNNVTDPVTFQQKKASSSDSDILSASVVDSEKATAGTNDLVVDNLATKAKVESGQFINDQKMVSENQYGGEYQTSISNFELVSGSGTLDPSSDTLEAISKEIDTSGSGMGSGGDGTNEVEISQGGQTEQYDLDGFENIQGFMDQVNSDFTNLNFSYDQDRDVFVVNPTNSDGSGGSTFELDDLSDDKGSIESGKGFFEQTGLTADATTHKFSQRQSTINESLIEIDPENSFSQNLLTSPISDGDSGTININGTAIDWNTDKDNDAGVSTVNGLVDKINSDVEGVEANYSSATDKITLENTKPGQGKIDVTDESNGANVELADALNLETEEDSVNVDNSNVLASDTAGEDAIVDFNGTKIRESRNTFTRDGIEYTLKQENTSEIEVSVEDDTESITSDVEKFVEKFNKTIGFINEKSSTEPAEEPGGENNSGPLAGDSLSRGLKNTLTRMVSSRYNEATSGNDIQSLADVGIELKDPLSASDKNKGKLNFNKSKFKEALNNNPQQVRELFTAEEGDSSKGGAQDGVAVQVNEYIEGVSGSNGVIADRIDGFDSEVNRLNERIEEQEDRVENKRERLEAKFRRMEESLRQLQQQQGFLGG